MSIAVYPGSFDPVTYGHIDIIERSAKVFDKLIIAVLVNSAKKPMFTTQEKVDMIRKVTSHLDNVEVSEMVPPYVQECLEKKFKS